MPELPAVAGAILAGMTTRFGPAELPSDDGFRVAPAIGGGAALVSFLIAFFPPRHARAAAPAPAVRGESVPFTATER
ncbi:hypothetical protein ABZW11_44835 [Nonomuraea sp. NPDC004580]|uniref:hypothetical protein n=1 Tax=Nonomuraea sp. NPDC004580 TaxID=3154552 RepID=UPI0033A6BD12